MTPFEMDWGWNPKTPLDLVSIVLNDIVQNSEDFTVQLEESIKNAQCAYKVAKARQTAYSAEKAKPPTYHEDDKIWIKHTLYRDA